MNFNEELNENQYKAVSDTSQYLKIIAGAGSGKTRVLTYRIAYLIKEMHVNPYSILAITFTNKVAKEMQTRALKLVEGENIFSLNIFTYHSFCSRFLRKEIGALDLTKNFFILDDDDKEKLFKNIGVEKGYRKSDEIIKDANNYVSFYKMKGKLPSDIDRKELQNPKKKIYLEFFEEYESRKNAMNYLDFDDLLIYTVKILKENPQIRDKWAKRFSNILIDEFQDTNDVQYALVKLLCNEETNLYVVGDPDQTIYTWRGANQDIILNIDKDFFPMTPIILNQNYRSTTKILNAANSLIAHNLKRYKKDLFTLNNEGNDVDLRVFVTKNQEAKFVASKIKEIKRRNNCDYSDFTILYRSSFISLPFEKALNSNNIPYRVYGGTRFYDRAEVKDCIAYFRLILNKKDDVSFDRIINVPTRGIGETSYQLLKDECFANKLSIFEYISNILNYETNLQTRVIRSIKNLINHLEEARKEIENDRENTPEILLTFLNNIDYFQYLKHKDEDKGDEKEENVIALIDDLKTYLKENREATLIDYLSNVALTSSQDDIKDVNSINMMTIHTAKGLEFPYVFLVGLEEGVFPNNRAVRESKDGLEEERRLCYVAITRAKKELFLTYNRDFNFATQSNSSASRFIEEAGISTPLGDTISFLNYNKSNIEKEKETRYTYSFDENNKNNSNLNVIDLAKPQTNNITWYVGDKVYHETFKSGEVIEINGNIIRVKFDDFGEKSLIANHFKLKKVEK